MKRFLHNTKLKVCGIVLFAIAMVLSSAIMLGTNNTKSRMANADVTETIESDYWEDYASFGSEGIVATGSIDSANRLITISSAQELAWVAQQTNLGGEITYASNGSSTTFVQVKNAFGNKISTKGFATLTIELTADIDLSGKFWTPIGASSDTPFMGKFIGNGHKISGVTFDSSQNYSATFENTTYSLKSLFGCVNSNSFSYLANINDLIVENCHNSVANIIAYCNLASVNGCVAYGQNLYGAKTAYSSIQNSLKRDGEKWVDAVTGEEATYNGVNNVYYEVATKDEGEASFTNVVNGSGIWTSGNINLKDLISLDTEGVISEITVKTYKIAQDSLDFDDGITTTLNAAWQVDSLTSLKLKFVSGEANRGFGFTDGTDTIDLRREHDIASLNTTLQIKYAHQTAVRIEIVKAKKYVPINFTIKVLNSNDYNKISKYFGSPNNDGVTQLSGSWNKYITCQGLNNIGDQFYARLGTDGLTVTINNTRKITGYYLSSGSNSNGSNSNSWESESSFSSEEQTDSEDTHSNSWVEKSSFLCDVKTGSEYILYLRNVKGVTLNNFTADYVENNDKTGKIVVSGKSNDYNAYVVYSPPSESSGGDWSAKFYHNISTSGVSNYISAVYLLTSDDAGMGGSHVCKEAPTGGTPLSSLTNGSNYDLTADTLYCIWVLQSYTIKISRASGFNDGNLSYWFINPYTKDEDEGKQVGNESSKGISIFATYELLIKSNYGTTSPTYIAKASIKKASGDTDDVYFNNPTKDSEGNYKETKSVIPSVSGEAEVELSKEDITASIILQYRLGEEDATNYVAEAKIEYTDHNQNIDSSSVNLTKELIIKTKFNQGSKLYRLGSIAINEGSEGSINNTGTIVNDGEYDTITFNFNDGDHNLISLYGKTITITLNVVMYTQVVNITIRDDGARPYTFKTTLSKKSEPCWTDFNTKKIIEYANFDYCKLDGVEAENDGSKNFTWEILKDGRIKFIFGAMPYKGSPYEIEMYFEPIEYTYTIKQQKRVDGKTTNVLPVKTFNFNKNDNISFTYDQTSQTYKVSKIDYTFSLKNYNIDDIKSSGTTSGYVIIQKGDLETILTYVPAGISYSVSCVDENGNTITSPYKTGLEYMGKDAPITPESIALYKFDHFEVKKKIDGEAKYVDKGQKIYCSYDDFAGYLVGEDTTVQIKAVYTAIKYTIYFDKTPGSNSTSNVYKSGSDTYTINGTGSTTSIGSNTLAGIFGNNVPTGYKLTGFYTNLEKTVNSDGLTVENFKDFTMVKAGYSLSDYLAELGATDDVPIHLIPYFVADDVSFTFKRVENENVATLTITNGFGHGNTLGNTPIKDNKVEWGNIKLSNNKTISGLNTELKGSGWIIEKWYVSGNTNDVIYNKQTGVYATWNTGKITQTSYTIVSDYHPNVINTTFDNGYSVIANTLTPTVIYETNSYKNGTSAFKLTSLPVRNGFEFLYYKASYNNQDFYVYFFKDGNEKGYVDTSSGKTTKVTFSNFTGKIEEIKLTFYACWEASGVSINAVGEDEQEAPTYNGQEQSYKLAKITNIPDHVSGEDYVSYYSSYVTVYRNGTKIDYGKAISGGGVKYTIDNKDDGILVTLHGLKYVADGGSYTVCFGKVGSLDGNEFTVTNNYIYDYENIKKQINVKGEIEFSINPIALQIVGEKDLTIGSDKYKLISKAYDGMVSAPSVKGILLCDAEILKVEAYFTKELRGEEVSDVCKKYGLKSSNYYEIWYSKAKYASASEAEFNLVKECYVIGEEEKHSNERYRADEYLGQITQREIKFNKIANSSEIFLTNDEISNNKVVLYQGYISEGTLVITADRSGALGVMPMVLNDASAMPSISNLDDIKGILNLAKRTATFEIIYSDFNYSGNKATGGSLTINITTYEGELNDSVLKSDLGQAVQGLTLVQEQESYGVADPFVGSIDDGSELNIKKVDPIAQRQFIFNLVDKNGKSISSDIATIISGASATNTTFTNISSSSLSIVKSGLNSADNEEKLSISFAIVYKDGTYWVKNEDLAAVAKRNTTTQVETFNYEIDKPEEATTVINIVLKNTSTVTFELGLLSGAFKLSGSSIDYYDVVKYGTKYVTEITWDDVVYDSQVSLPNIGRYARTSNYYGYQYTEQSLYFAGWMYFDVQGNEKRVATNNLKQDWNYRKDITFYAIWLYNFNSNVISNGIHSDEWGYNQGTSSTLEVKNYYPAISGLKYESHWMFNDSVKDQSSITVHNVEDSGQYEFFATIYGIPTYVIDGVYYSSVKFNEHDDFVVSDPQIKDADYTYYVSGKKVEIKAGTAYISISLKNKVNYTITKNQIALNIVHNEYVKENVSSFNYKLTSADLASEGQLPAELEGQLLRLTYYNELNQKSWEPGATIKPDIPGSVALVKYDSSKRAYVEWEPLNTNYTFTGISGEIQKRVIVIDIGENWFTYSGNNHEVSNSNAYFIDNSSLGSDGKYGVKRNYSYRITTTDDAVGKYFQEYYDYYTLYCSEEYEKNGIIYCGDNPFEELINGQALNLTNNKVDYGTSYRLDLRTDSKWTIENEYHDNFEDYKDIFDKYYDFFVTGIKSSDGYLGESKNPINVSSEWGVDYAKFFDKLYDIFQYDNLRMWGSYSSWYNIDSKRMIDKSAFMTLNNENAFLKYFAEESQYYTPNNITRSQVEEALSVIFGFDNVTQFKAGVNDLASKLSSNPSYVDGAFVSNFPNYHETNNAGKKTYLFPFTLRYNNNDRDSDLFDMIFALIYDEEGNLGVWFADLKLAIDIVNNIDNAEKVQLFGKCALFDDDLYLEYRYSNSYSLPTLYSYKVYKDQLKRDGLEPKSYSEYMQSLGVLNPTLDKATNFLTYYECKEGQESSTLQFYDTNWAEMSGLENRFTIKIKGFIGIIPSDYLQYDNETSYFDYNGSVQTPKIYTYEDDEEVYLQPGAFEDGGDYLIYYANEDGTPSDRLFDAKDVGIYDVVYVCNYPNHFEDNIGFTIHINALNIYTKFLHTISKDYDGTTDVYGLNGQKGLVYGVDYKLYTNYKTEEYNSEKGYWYYTFDEADELPENLRQEAAQSLTFAYINTNNQSGNYIIIDSINNNFYALEYNYDCEVKEPIYIQLELGDVRIEFDTFKASDSYYIDLNNDMLVGEMVADEFYGYISIELGALRNDINELIDLTISAFEFDNNSKNTGTLTLKYTKSGQQKTFTCLFGITLAYINSGVYFDYYRSDTYKVNGITGTLKLVQKVIELELTETELVYNGSYLYPSFRTNYDGYSSDILEQYQIYKVKDHNGNTVNEVIYDLDRNIDENTYYVGEYEIKYRLKNNSLKQSYSFDETKGYRFTIVKAKYNFIDLSQRTQNFNGNKFTYDFENLNIYWNYISWTGNNTGDRYNARGLGNDTFNANLYFETNGTDVGTYIYQSDEENNTAVIKTRAAENDTSVLFVRYLSRVVYDEFGISSIEDYYEDVTFNYDIKAIKIILEICKAESLTADQIRVNDNQNIYYDGSFQDLTVWLWDNEYVIEAGQTSTGSEYNGITISIVQFTTDDAHTERFGAQPFKYAGYYLIKVDVDPDSIVGNSSASLWTRIYANSLNDFSYLYDSSKIYDGTDDVYYTDGDGHTTRGLCNLDAYGDEIIYENDLNYIDLQARYAGTSVDRHDINCEVKVKDVSQALNSEWKLVLNSYLINDETLYTLYSSAVVKTDAISSFYLGYGYIYAREITLRYNSNEDIYYNGEYFVADITNFVIDDAHDTSYASELPIELNGATGSVTVGIINAGSYANLSDYNYNFWLNDLSFNEDNYNITISGSLTVKPAELVVYSVSDNGNITYDGEAHYVTLTATVYEGHGSIPDDLDPSYLLTAKYKPFTLDDNQRVYREVTEHPTNAGYYEIMPETYDYYYNVTNNFTYVGDDLESILTINKRSLSIVGSYWEYTRLNQYGAIVLDNYDISYDIYGDGLAPAQFIEFELEIPLNEYGVKTLYLDEGYLKSLEITYSNEDYTQNYQLNSINIEVTVYERDHSLYQADNLTYNAKDQTTSMEIRVEYGDYDCTISFGQSNTIGDTISAGVVKYIRPNEYNAFLVGFASWAANNEENEDLNIAYAEYLSADVNARSKYLVGEFDELINAGTYYAVVKLNQGVTDTIYFVEVSIDKKEIDTYYLKNTDGSAFGGSKVYDGTSTVSLTSNDICKKASNELDDVSIIGTYLDYWESETSNCNDAYYIAYQLSGISSANYYLNDEMSYGNILLRQVTITDLKDMSKTLTYAGDRRIDVDANKLVYGENDIVSGQTLSGKIYLNVDSVNDYYLSSANINGLVVTGSNNKDVTSNYDFSFADSLKITVIAAEVTVGWTMSDNLKYNGTDRINEVKQNLNLSGSYVGDAINYLEVVFTKGNDTASELINAGNYVISSVSSSSNNFNFVIDTNNNTVTIDKIDAWLTVNNSVRYSNYDASGLSGYEKIKVDGDVYTDLSTLEVIKYVISGTLTPKTYYAANRELEFVEDSNYSQAEVNYNLYLQGELLVSADSIDVVNVTKVYDGTDSYSGLTVSYYQYTGNNDSTGTLYTISTWDSTQPAYIQNVTKNGNIVTEIKYAGEYIINVVINTVPKECHFVITAKKINTFTNTENWTKDYDANDNVLGSVMPEKENGVYPIDPSIISFTATYEDKDVGTGKDVYVVATWRNGAAQELINSYIVPNVSNPTTIEGIGTIQKKVVQINYTQQSPIYYTNEAFSMNIDVSGAGSERITGTFTLEEAVNAGIYTKTNLLINVSEQDLTISGQDASFDNYELYFNGTITISAAEVTANITNKDYIYDAKEHFVKIVAVEDKGKIVAGDEGKILNVAYSKDGNVVQNPTDAGEYTLTISVVGAFSTNYILIGDYSNEKLTISKREIKIIADVNRNFEITLNDFTYNLENSNVFDVEKDELYMLSGHKVSGYVTINNSDYKEDAFTFNSLLDISSFDIKDKNNVSVKNNYEVEDVDITITIGNGNTTANAAMNGPYYYSGADQINSLSFKVTYYVNGKKQEENVGNVQTITINSVELIKSLGIFDSLANAENVASENGKLNEIINAGTYFGRIYVHTTRTYYYPEITVSKKVLELNKLTYNEQPFSGAKVYDNSENIVLSHSDLCTNADRQNISIVGTYKQNNNNIKDAGTGYTIALQITGIGAGNYELSANSINNGQIKPKDITVVSYSPSQSYYYGGSSITIDSDDLGLEANALYGNDELSGNIEIAVTNAGDYFLEKGTNNLTINDGASDNYNILISPELKATLNKKAITISWVETAENKITYSASVNTQKVISNLTLSDNAFKEEIVNDINIVFTYLSEDSNDVKDAGSYIIKSATSNSGNFVYTISNINNTVEVYKKNIKINIGEVKVKFSDYTNSGINLKLENISGIENPDNGYVNDCVYKIIGNKQVGTTYSFAQNGLSIVLGTEINNNYAVQEALGSLYIDADRIEFVELDGIEYNGQDHRSEIVVKYMLGENEKTITESVSEWGQIKGYKFNGENVNEIVKAGDYKVVVEVNTATYEVNLTITPKTISHINFSQKQYDGNVTVYLFSNNEWTTSLTSDDIISGDVVGITGSYADNKVGEKSITFTLTGNDAENYVAVDNIKGTIIERQVTIDLTGSLTYNYTNNYELQNPTITTIAQGDELFNGVVGFELSTNAVGELQVVNGISVKNIAVKIIRGEEDVTNYYKISYIGTLTTTPKQFEVLFTQPSALDLVFNYASKTVSFTLDGINEAEQNAVRPNVTLAYYSVVSNVETEIAKGQYPTNVGDYKVVASFSGNNYSLVGNTSTSYSITPYTYVVGSDDEINTFTKEYSKQDPSLIQTFTAMFEGRKYNFNVEYGRELGEEIGKYNLQNALSKNINIIFSCESAYLDAKFEIVKNISDKLTINLTEFKNISKANRIYGQEELNVFKVSDFNYTAKISGTTLTLLDGVDGNSNVTFNMGNVGEYGLNTALTKIESSNFQNVVVSGDVKINILPRRVQISATNYDKTYDGTVEFTNEFTISDLDTSGVAFDMDASEIGLQIEYASKDVGEQDLVVTNNTFNNYDVVFATAKGNINRIKVTVEINDHATIYGDKYNFVYSVSLYNGEATTITNEQLQKEINVSVVGEQLSTSGQLEAGEYQLLVTPGQNVQIMNDVTGKILTVNAKNITIVPNERMVKNQDGNNQIDVNNYTYSLVGVTSGDVVTVSGAQYINAAAGTNKDITFTLSGADASNYNPLTTQGDILAKEITFKFNYVYEGCQIPAEEAEGISDGGINQLKFNYFSSINDSAIGLPMPKHVGLGLMGAGWSLTKGGNAIDLNKKICEYITDENTTEVELYCIWSVQTIKVKVVLMHFTLSSGGFQPINKGEYNVAINSSVSYNEQNKTLTISSSVGCVVNVSNDLDFENYKYLGVGLNNTSNLNKEEFTIENDVTLYIVYDLKTYTVTFQSNGGVFTTTDTRYETVDGGISLNVRHGQTLGGAISNATSIIPSREGYSFDGWNENKLSNTDLMNQVVEGDLEYAAQWKANTYTLTLNANDGNFETYGDGWTVGSAGKTISKVFEYGETISNLPEPIRPYYQFSGYQNAAGAIFVMDKWGINNNLEIYASYIPYTYTLNITAVNATFKVRGKDSSGTNISNSEISTSLSITVQTSSIIEVVATPNEGYHFGNAQFIGNGGVKGDNSYTYNNGFSGNNGSTISLTVIAEANLNTITLQSNQNSFGAIEYHVGGTTYSSNDIEHNSFDKLTGDTVTLTVNPREGYKVKNVYVLNEGGTINQNGSDYILSNFKSNITVYAEFEAKELEIQLENESGGNIIYQGISNSGTISVTTKTGETIEFIVRPNYGYELDEISLSDGFTANVSTTLDGGDVKVTLSGYKTNGIVQVLYKFEQFAVTAKYAEYNDLTKAIEPMNDVNGQLIEITFNDQSRKLGYNEFASYDYLTELQISPALEKDGFELYGFMRYDVTNQEFVNIGTRNDSGIALTIQDNYDIYLVYQRKTFTVKYEIYDVRAASILANGSVYEKYVTTVLFGRTAPEVAIDLKEYRQFNGWSKKILNAYDELVEVERITDETLSNQIVNSDVTYVALVEGEINTFNIIVKGKGAYQIESNEYASVITKLIQSESVNDNAVVGEIVKTTDEDDNAIIRIPITYKAGDDFKFKLNVNDYYQVKIGGNLLELDDYTFEIKNIDPSGYNAENPYVIDLDLRYFEVKLKANESVLSLGIYDNHCVGLDVESRVNSESLDLGTLKVQYGGKISLTYKILNVYRFVGQASTSGNEFAGINNHSLSGEMVIDNVTSSTEINFTFAKEKYKIVFNTNYVIAGQSMGEQKSFTYYAEYGDKTLKDSNGNDVDITELLNAQTLNYEAAIYGFNGWSISETSGELNKRYKFDENNEIYVVGNEENSGFDGGASGYKTYDGDYVLVNLYGSWFEYVFDLSVKFRPGFSYNNIKDIFQPVYGITNLSSVDEPGDNEQNVKVLYGTPISVNSVPTFNGYDYFGWSLSGDSEVRLGLPKFNMLPLDVELTLWYSFTITVEDGDDGINTATVNGKKQYECLENEEITLSATPGRGFVFDHWLVNGEKDETLPAEFTTSSLNAATTYTAVFRSKIAQVTLGDTAHAPITLDVTEAIVGQTIRIYIDLDAVEYGYEMVGVIVECGDLSTAVSNFVQSGGLTYYEYMVSQDDVENGLIEISSIVNIKLLNVEFRINIPNCAIIYADDRVVTDEVMNYSYNTLLTITHETARRYKLTEILVNGTPYPLTNTFTLRLIKENGFNVGDNSYNLIEFNYAKMFWIDNYEKPVGYGTEEAPFIITSGSQLAYLAYIFENQLNTEACYYRIGNDIDLSEMFWTPIGTMENPFDGIFELGKFKITGAITLEEYTYFDWNEYCKNVFGYVSSDAKIIITRSSLPTILLAVGLSVGASLILAIILIIIARKKKKVKKLSNAQASLLTEANVVHIADNDPKTQKQELVKPTEDIKLNKGDVVASKSSIRVDKKIPINATIKDKPLAKVPPKAPGKKPNLSINDIIEKAQNSTKPPKK